MSRLVEEDGGWYRWNGQPAYLGIVRVKVAMADDGRWHLTALQLEGPVSAEALRGIPVGRIEATANSQLHGDEGPRPAVRNARVPDRLRSSPGRGYSDAFYEAIAAIYGGLAVTSGSPVVDLAEANDVPVTTAQRWVKEARRRALLPPGRAGKAG